MSVKCYGSTSVSKTESRGSTPCTDAKYKVEQCCGPVAFYYVKQILHSVGVRCVRPKDMRLTGCQICERGGMVTQRIANPCRKTMQVRVLSLTPKKVDIVLNMSYNIHII